MQDRRRVSGLANRMAVDAGQAWLSTWSMGVVLSLAYAPHGPPLHLVIMNTARDHTPSSR